MEKGRCISNPEIRCPYYAGGVVPICGVCKHYEHTGVYVEFNEEYNTWATNGCLLNMSIPCILPEEEVISLSVCSICEKGGFRKLNEMLMGRGKDV